MVRLKTRWILLRLDFPSDVGFRKQTKEGGNNNLKALDGQFPSRKEVFIAINNNHIENFGVAGTGEAQDIQVRFCDPVTRLVLIRIPRDAFPRVRSTLTLITSIIRRRVVVNIIGVNGSVRTAKRSAIEHVRGIYRKYFQQQTISGEIMSKKGAGKLASKTVKECASLEQTLSALHSIEF